MKKVKEVVRAAVTDDWRHEVDKLVGVGAVGAARAKPAIGYRGSGSLALDVALGGGWPRDRIVQLTGYQSSGKTLLFEMAAIEAQKHEGKRSLLFDFERTFDPVRFASLGGDTSMLDIVTHESVSKLPMLFAETAFDICKQAVPHGEYACICFDSTGAMVSARTYGKQMEDGQEASAPMNTARAMSEGLPILLGLMARAASQPTIFFVCQGRDNIGAFSFRGPAEDKQTGGRALPFYSAIVARVRKGDTYKGDIDGGEKDVEVGHVTKVTIRKNKANGVQGRTALFDVYHAGGLNGIDRVSELAQLAVFTRVVIRRGAWVEYSGQPSLADGATAPSGPSVWNGLEAFKSALKAPALFALVEREVRAALTTIMDQTKDDADAD